MAVTMLRSSGTDGPSQAWPGRKMVRGYLLCRVVCRRALTPGAVGADSRPLRI